MWVLRLGLCSLRELKFHECPCSGTSFLAFFFLGPWYPFEYLVGKFVFDSCIFYPLYPDEKSEKHGQRAQDRNIVKNKRAGRKMKMEIQKMGETVTKFPRGSIL